MFSLISVSFLNLALFRGTESCRSGLTFRFAAFINLTKPATPYTRTLVATARKMSMKKVILKELPETLTSELIEILAIMANEFPKVNSDWNEISELLEKRGQLRAVLDKALELQRKASEITYSQMTDEERRIEQEKIKKSLNSDKFSGNMGEPW